MGNVYYSRNLSYTDWYRFNNAQRAHYKYVEWIASSLVFLLIAGIQFPIPSACVGAGVIVARFIYACGYTSRGPKGRLIGGLLNDVLVLALFALAIISAINVIKL
jgi:glutathione S-transferase